MVADKAGLTVLFGARMAGGAMGGNLAAADSYVTDVTPVDRRTGVSVAD